jgi:hypothetical protein
MKYHNPTVNAIVGQSSVDLTALRGCCKCVASPCSQVKNSRATGNSVKCGNYTVCFSLCMCKVLHCQNSLQVFEGVWNTCTVTETGVDVMQCFQSWQDMWATCNNPDTQPDDNACHADALYRRGQMH